jgi:hypothetical protein
VTGRSSLETTPGASQGSWRDDPMGVAPVVLVIGGFLSSPPMYAGFRERLLERGAAEVLVAPIWLPDWLLAAYRHGAGRLVTRAGRALLEAGRRSAASPASRGAPVLVIGHSAGGGLARLLTSPEPFEGRRLGAAGRIGALVTLGTPNHVHAAGDIGGRLSTVATTFLDRVAPGPAFAPTTGYLTVGSRADVARRHGTRGERRQHRFYAGLIGPGAPDEIPGDGVVPLECALLRDAPAIVFDDLYHGPGGIWYGSQRGLDGWWPVALETWRTALVARLGRTAAPPDPEASPMRAFDGEPVGG